MSLTKFSSRRAVLCPIFGSPKEFGELQLPTYEDVMRSCSEVRRCKGLQSGGNREPSFASIADVVAARILALYAKASIPTVCARRVTLMLHSYHAKYSKWRNELRQLHRCPGLHKKRSEFQKAALKLFDIASCKCPDFDSCECTKEKKIPVLERAFLLDPRGDRRLQIGGEDGAESKKLAHRLERKFRAERQEQSLS